MSFDVGTLLWVLLGAGLGGAAVSVVLRRGRADSAPVIIREAEEAEVAEVAAPVSPHPHERRDAPAEAGAGEASRDTAVDGPAALVDDGSAATAVPELRLRPHTMDPTLVGPRPVVELAGLGALARHGSPEALGASEAERLAAGVAAVAAGGVLALPGPSPTMLRHALRELHDLLGDVPVLGVPAPRRAGAGVATFAPVRALARDASPLARAGRCVVIVEDAELHLRRGLDRSALAQLREAAPSAVLLLVVGACEHDAASLDDAGRWLDDLVLSVGGDRIAAAGAHDPQLDVPLMAAAADAPLLADLAEAAAYACAAGRLPDVPLDVAARVAALIAGGSADEPAAAHQLGAAVAADTAEPPLLHFSGLDRDGLPTTVRASARLVARCVADPAVLTADLLAVLLDGADDVERLLVARRLTASERPGLALPALDALVAQDDPLLAAEARLVRGVARDRLGLATAADDYHAVATGGHGTLSVHGAFLLGGILETSDDLAPARAAYRRAIAAADPVHSAMAAFNLAWLEERAGDTDAALAGYREVAEGTHPDAAPLAALNLATLLERAKRFAECESWYRVALDAEHPDATPMAALSLGLLLERRQRPREALALFRRAAASGHAEAAPVALRRMGAPRR
jgi:tetratricopeptide (TPR) repeat protein